MPVLGITGGIASGKSTFVQALGKELPGEIFDADQCVKELLTDSKTIKALKNRFGEKLLLHPGGQIDKKALRSLVFSNAEQRRELEGILHPLVRERWVALLDKPRPKEAWLLVDIPLLFETNAESFFPEVVVVACPAFLQRARLTKFREMSPELAENIIASQLDLGSKISKANHVIWNAGSLDCLRAQTKFLSKYLRDRYG